MKKRRSKRIYFGVNICFLMLLILPYWKVISTFQFSDGIPMLNRVNSLKNGEVFISQYFFQAHGNSIHALVYLLAFLDDIFGGQSIWMLKVGVFIGMFMTGLFVDCVLWREESYLWINLVLSLACNVMITGTYNSDLYLPFQVVLSLSRFIFLWLLYQLSKNLMSREFDKKEWCFLIALSTLAALSHGMGMMFAAAVFYMHIATGQKKIMTAVSAVPLLVYNILQIIFNHGYGEVTASKFFFIKYFREFVMGLFAYYGGILYKLFGCPREIAVFCGAVIFFVTAFILLYFFAKGIFGEKMPGKCILKDVSGLLSLSVLGISFLASIGASAFVAARIDLVKSISNDPIENVIGTGRYLCFSVAPYIIGLYFILEMVKQEHNVRKYLLSAGSFFFLFFCIYSNTIISEKTMEKNQELDANATALLCGMDVFSKEMERAYGDFSDDWYWRVKIPIVYEQLQIEKKYIWKELPDMNSSLDNSKLKTMGASRIDYLECSDSDFIGIQLRCADKPELRYSAVIDELGNVVGYVYAHQNKGFYIENHHLYYDGNYYLRGYVKAGCKGIRKLYVLNQKMDMPAEKAGKVCIGSLQLADLTDLNWLNGVAADRGCLLVEYTDENFDLISKADFVGDGFRTFYNINSYDHVDGWLRIFITGSAKADNLKYPNHIYLYN